VNSEQDRENVLLWAVPSIQCVGHWVILV